MFIAINTLRSYIPLKARWAFAEQVDVFIISYQFFCGVSVPLLERFNTGLLTLVVQVVFNGDVVQMLLRAPCSLVTYI